MDMTPAADESTAADFSDPSDLSTSCHFCHLCKIPCSGHSVCHTCRTYNIDCVYVMEAVSGGRQPSKPRVHQARTENLSGYASPGPSLPSTVDSPSTASGGMRLLSEELETVSLRLFIPGHTVLSADIERSSYWHGAATRPPVHAGPKLPYRDVFVGLAQSIVELFQLRFNSLGCSPREQSGLADLSRLFFQHQGPLSFGTRAPPFPQQSFTDLRVQQLIEVWFSHHPLSFILSRNLLLHSYRNGTHDHELLALVLADASLFLGNEDMNVSHAMFEAARARVLERPAVSLSTIQALVLLGWHDFCLYRPQQGYCYLELARMIAAQRLTSPQSSPTEHHINNIDIHTVETELSQRTYWFTTAFSLWLSLHQASPDPDTLSPLDVAPLPPPDLSSSAVYALDGDSGSIAAVVAQKNAAHELWSFAHLTATIAPLFKLHLSTAPPQQQTPYWSPPLAPRPIDSVSAARTMLSAALARLPAQLDHSIPAQTFTHSAFHLLAVTVSFPSKHGDGMVPVGDVLRSVQTFLAATRTLARQAAMQDLLDHDLRTAPWVVLGLDVCGRALVRVRRGLGQQGQGKAAVVVEEMAKRLWEVSGERRLDNESGVRGMRERLGRLVGVVKEEERSTFTNGPVFSEPFGVDNAGWVEMGGGSRSSSGDSGTGWTGNNFNNTDETRFGVWNPGGF